MILHKKVLLIIVMALLVVGVLLFFAAHLSHPAVQTAATKVAPEQNGTDITVLLDVSASFAPYSQNDHLAMRRIAGAILELSREWWKPPVTIVWRRIGTSSLLSQPICNVFEFSPRMIDGNKSIEQLEASVSKCLKEATRQDVKPESYTDISGAIARAVQSRESSTATKMLIIFSDFKEDQSPRTHPADFRLNGETLVMVHRPGTDEISIPNYLDRIQQWKTRFNAIGAAQVLSFSLNLMTSRDLVQVLRPGANPEGTQVTVLLDSKDRFNFGQDGADGDMQYLQLLGQTVARSAEEWKPPVTVRFGTVGITALRMRWMPPQIFQRTMVQSPMQAEKLTDAPLKDVASLEIGIDESIRGLRRLAESGETADLSGAVSLAESDIRAGAYSNYLFIISDFLDRAHHYPEPLRASLRGVRVVMIYRPASIDSTDEHGFFERIQKWRETFSGAGADSVCPIEMATLTSRSVRSCLGMN